jgi:5'-nucleotidase / UDP-sugar diphosphatase
MKRFPWVLVLASFAVSRSFAQFEGFLNKGLVGVGRIPAATFDKAGTGTNDTLGGFSAMWVDPASLTYTNGFVGGILYGLPDRGFGDGATDYRPRLEVFQFTVTPDTNTSPVPQTQVVFTNTATRLFTYGGTNLFTGYDANDNASLAFPRSATNSLGGGRRSFDPEGLVAAPDGGWYVSDEYGPSIYKFDANLDLQFMLLPPAALIPKVGGYPATNRFTATAAPASGRRNNRGLEGLTISPDGRRVFAMLQSPAMQDGGGGNLGRLTRQLEFDVDTNSPTFGQVLTEHVYQLTLNGSAQTNRHTPISEILRITPSTFLMLERDGLGLGTGTNVASTYKRIVLATTTGATNIAGTGYDLERGHPSGRVLPSDAPPTDIALMRRSDFVDLIDPLQLARFGLNADAVLNTNTVAEKWEGLAVVPLRDPAAPDDYLLLVGCDNDFKAPLVFHNGQVVGTNDVPVDIMILAYRVTLPGYGSTNGAINSPPLAQLSIPSPSRRWAAAAPLPLLAQAYDDDGRIVRAEFFEGTNSLGAVMGFPWTITVTNAAVGTRTYRCVVTDNAGATGETSIEIEVVTGNAAPDVALTAPVEGSRFTAPAAVRMTAAVADSDGVVTNVGFLANGVRVGTATAAPFSFTLSNAPVGSHVLTAIATDNLGLSTTSAPVQISVLRTRSEPLSVQILHASDFEGGIPALEDAVGFSSVLNALRAEFPTNTLVLSSGDNYIPGPFFTSSADPAAPYNGVKGRGDIAILNAFGIQASACGNHEFDDNTAQFASMLRADSAVGYAGTLFPYLSANLDFNADSNTRGLIGGDALDWRAGTNRVARSTTITVGGQLIGIVGATTIELRQISSPGSITVLTNLVGTIQPAVDALLARGCNKVILLAHLQQYANEFALATALRDVDVIIAGGSHSVFARATDRLRDGDVRAEDYPVTFSSASGEPVHVINTGANYRYVGRLLLDFDADGRVVRLDSRSGAYATDAAGVAATGNVAPSAAVTNITAVLGSIIDAKDGVRFGRTAVYLNGLRQSVRTEESNLGNLTADANLWRARQTDTNVSLSLKNGGGIRDSIGAIASSTGNALPQRVPPPANPRVGKQAGEVSQLDIENSLRFNNALAVITLTAQQLRDAMEWSVAATTPTGTPGQFPQIAGMWMAFEPTNAPMTYTRNTNNAVTGINNPGARLRTLVATRADGSHDLVVDNGVLIGDTNRAFRMVTLDFLAGGGDTYYPLTLASSSNNLAAGVTNRVFSTDGGEQRALADYLLSVGIVFPRDTERAGDLRIQNLAFRGNTAAGAQLGAISITNGAVLLPFSTLEGRSYQPQARTDGSAPWQSFGSPITGDGRVQSALDPGATNNPMRLYRVLQP